MQSKIGSLYSFLKAKPTAEDISVAILEEEEEKYVYPMSNRAEIISWYLYDWANSPQYNLLIGLTFPLFVYVLAAEYACENNTPFGCDVNFDPINSSTNLQVSMGEWKLTPASFAFAVISISGALQAFAYIAFGALADYGAYRYYMFRGCTIIACSMNIVFFFCWDASSFMFVGWWGAFQLIFFGLGIIYYNSTLPDIVENHWLVRRAIRENVNTDEISELKATITDDMSQFGYALGYCASLWLTIVAVLLFAAMTVTTTQELTGYGLQSTSDSSITIDSYEELWLKTVDEIEISFTDEYITSIQLKYADIDLDGDIHPSSSIQSTFASSLVNQTTSKTYITSGDYISEIQLWYHSIGNSIRSMRFVSKANVMSDLFGNQNVSESEYESIKGDSNDGDFVFAGYTVYTATNLMSSDSSIVVVSGMDILMVNQDTGQFASTLDYRIVFLLVFFWWFLFQLITFKYLKRRDKPPIPEDSSFWTISFKDFYFAFKQSREYPHMFRYLISWFLFSDGLGTMLIAAVLFAREELSMTQTELALILLEVMLTSSVGGIMFLKIQHLLHFNAKQMILIHLCFFIGCSLYSMFGLLPGCPFGLCSKLELYLYIIPWGANIGAIQSYSRSCFSQLIPIGMESQMFSLYEITDKGSSWIGPLMVALIGNVASIRWALFYVLIFFAIPLPILIYGVNMKEGIKAAGRAEVSEDMNDNMKDDSTNIGSQVIPIVNVELATTGGMKEKGVRDSVEVGDEESIG